MQSDMEKLAIIRSRLIEQMYKNSEEKKWYEYLGIITYTLIIIWATKSFLV